MKKETISKTIRIPKTINESIGELSSKNDISLNKFIVSACALALTLNKLGMLRMDGFTRCADDYSELS